MTEYEQNIEIMKDLKNRLDQIIASQPTKSFNIPDPLKHKYISFVKSAIRIAAGIALIWPQNIIIAGVFLIIAEVLGVLEEMV